VPNGPKNSYLNSHEANVAVILPLFVLALFSIFFGFVFSDLFVGVGSDFFANSLFIHPNNISIIEAEFSLPILIKLFPSILSLFGALLAIFLYHKSTSFVIDLTETSLGRKIYTFLNGKYLFDVVYNNYITYVGLQLGYTISKVIDRGVIELLGPQGLSNIFTNTGYNISKLDSGVITTYALYITLGLLALLFLVFAPILIDTSLFSEIRLIIIYFASLIIVLSPAFAKASAQIKKSN
jgi:NADH-ubiquinone oxidoreductase chain 5